MRNLQWVYLLIGCLALLLNACAADDFQGDGAFTDHDESSDFDPVEDVAGKGDSVSSSFQPSRVVSEAFFTDSDALTADQIQGFLENTPYGRRTWLATERVNGQRAADVIHAAALRHGINPMMLVIRFQVEGSHISRSSRPSNSSVDRSLGCGCFDGESCRSAYLGLDKQIDCAADTYEKRHDGSIDGSWAWRKGTAKRSLDGVWVTPENHATAALYAYTPWVLRNRGGNWLFWNVAKKFVNHLASVGIDNFDGDGGGDGDSSRPAWIGTPCATDNDCDFADGENFGFCYDFQTSTTGETRGFCSLVCEGFCPDRSGHATTFCIASDVEEVGICAAKAMPENYYCRDIDGTSQQDLARFIGDSSAPDRIDSVCAPE